MRSLRLVFVSTCLILLAPVAAVAVPGESALT
jgi:hypothetical protein